MNNNGYLSVRQASEFTGLSIRFIYLLVFRRELRHYRIGKKIVIGKADLESFLAERVIEAKEMKNG